MNTKELEILKKLLKIAENQQKVLVKLAQDQRGINPIDPNTPFGKSVIRPNHPNNPYGVDDHFGGGQFDPLAELQTTPNTPAKTQAPSKPGSTPPVAPLSAEITQALNRNYSTNGYRGSLLIEVNGKTLNVKYNTDYEMDDASTVKRNIEQALPGYLVTVIGESHSDWAANHQANF